jgi:hypothetical protein
LVGGAAGFSFENPLGNLVADFDRSAVAIGGKYRIGCEAKKMIELRAIGPSR